MKQKQKQKIPLLLAGAATGLINGLFGSGGGLLAVVILERIQGLNKSEAHATALIVMLPLTVVSIGVYWLRGILEWNAAPFVALGLVPASIFGAKLLGRLRGVWINRLFCVLMLAAGLRLLF